MKTLIRDVLKKVKPSENEIKQDIDMANKIIAKIKAIEGAHIDVQLAGSLARDTNLRGDRDLDIFVLFPRNLSRDVFEKEGLRIGKEVFRGHFWEESYSEHPYIRGNIDGFDIEIVPSYKIDDATEKLSAVDRSPIHNNYLLGKLSKTQKDEVRLVRQFLKGIGCYGADLKMSSVPGYVTELLILKYGNFENFIKNAVNWKNGEVIDIENYYKHESDACKKFDSHFIVVDPTDKNRNVAAALSYDQYSRLVAATRAFLKKPSNNFFFGKKFKKWEVKKVKDLLKKKELIAIKMQYPKNANLDVIYGQIKKFRRKMLNVLEYYEFRAYHGKEWTDEKNEIVIILELENLKIQQVTKHFGPEVTQKEHSEKFLSENKKITAGPWIQNGRWVVEKLRKYSDANILIKEFLNKEKSIQRLPLKKAIAKAKIIHEPEIINMYKKDSGFAEFLTDYLKSKEKFLDY
ncbi:MAG: CCA tRNA nucleotidyltransferase [Candidatus Diapherotrites archaeon]